MQGSTSRPYSSPSLASTSMCDPEIIQLLIPPSLRDDGEAALPHVLTGFRAVNCWLL